VLLVAGLASGGIMQIMVAPLLGLDAPVPFKAKDRYPDARLTRWAKAGLLRDFVDGLPKEVRVRTQRVVIVRQGETAYALNGLCSHARLPLAGLPGSPIRANPIQDNCIMCPFHGARFDIATGKAVRQPFDSQFNNDHPLLGKLQSKLFKGLSFVPIPYQAFPIPKLARPTMTAEDTQTYPVRIESGEVMVGLPK
jgi:nitrite reductase/ring-hydroxylating ferredoxin subunit